MPSLHWIGKEAVVNHHHAVPFHLLRDVPELSVGAPGAGNLIVQGDNLVALKALLPYYAGQVKCIYIDPPYNTGNESWIYNDNSNSPLIRAWLGKTVGKEAEDLSRHDKWLCMMYPRLALLRQFLRDDGAIFISIDDNESANLIQICDEIFGLQNRILQGVWIKRVSPANDAKYFSSDHEFVIIYAKRKDVWRPQKLKRTAKQLSNYRNPDNDSRGDWNSVTYTCNKSTDERPNLYHGIKNPNTGEIVWPKKTAVWKYDAARHIENQAKGLVWWGSDGKARMPRLKRFLDEMGDVVPRSFFHYDDAGHTQEARSELLEIIHECSFTTPKAARLIGRIIELATNPGDLILDSFAGSGTTGHAVLKLNAELAAQGSSEPPPGLGLRQPSGALGGDALPPSDVQTSLPSSTPGEQRQRTAALQDAAAHNTPAPRRFILVEMESKIARDITAERVKRVAQGYTNAKGEKVEGLGGGFRFCELGEPLFDESGKIRETVRFADLARHVYFTETGEPLPRERVPNTPFLGDCRGVGIYLLFNGILGDKSANGGNILTRAVLAQLPKFDGQKVIYCAGCLLGKDRLQAERIIVRQTPYEIKVS